MKLAVITPNRLQSRILINRLHLSGFSPDLILLYKAVPNKISLIRLIKRQLRAYLYFFSDYEKIQRIIHKNMNKAIRVLTNYAIKKNIPIGLSLPAQTIADVNSAEVAELLRSNKIDVLFIWGVPILKGNNV